MENNNIKKPRQLSFINLSEDKPYFSLDDKNWGQTNLTSLGNAAVIQKEGKQGTYLEATIQTHIANFKTKEIFKTSFVITTKSKYELVTEFDLRVWTTIKDMCSQKDSRTIETTFYEILKNTPGLDTKGEDYKKVQMSLERLKHSDVYSESWVDPETGDPFNESLPYIDIYQRFIDEKKTPKIEVEKGVFEYAAEKKYKPKFRVGMHETFWKLIKHGSIVDHGVLEMFNRKPLLRNLFRWLNVIFNDIDSIEIDIRTLASEIGMEASNDLPDSRLKSDMTRRYFKSLAQEKIIQPVTKESFKKRKDDGRIIWSVTIEAGELYADLKERFDLHLRPKNYDIFMRLREFTIGSRTIHGFTPTEALHIIEENTTGSDRYIEGRGLDALNRDLDYFSLCLSIAPHEIKSPKAWLRKATKATPPWDHSSAMSILLYLKNKETALTHFQQSNVATDMNSSESELYHFLIAIPKMDKQTAHSLIRICKNHDRIFNLTRKWASLDSKQQTAAFAVKYIQEGYGSINETPIKGSEHETVQNKVAETSSRYKESFIPDEIEIVPEEPLEAVLPPSKACYAQEQQLDLFSVPSTATQTTDPNDAIAEYIKSKGLTVEQFIKQMKQE